MKKRVLFMTLFVFLMMPLCIDADTYTEALEKANVFLDKNEYKNSYMKYLFTSNTDRYTGMISKEEVDITRYDKNKNYRNINYSYLWDSRPFWSNVTNVPIREGYNALSAGESTDNIGTKLTQIIKNDVSVYGSGTYSDPWLFSPQYRVRIKVNDINKGYITNKDYNTKEDEINFVYTVGSGIQYIYIKSVGANQYLGSTCGYVVNSINANTELKGGELGGYLLVSDITRDTECMINFGEKPRTVKLDNDPEYKNSSSPTELYMSPETGWYLDKFGNEQIIEIYSNPERQGYIYEGYRVADSRENACNSTTNIIEPPYKDLASNSYNLVSNPKNKRLITDRNILKNIENNDTLYACYTPIRYTVAYNCNGATGGSTASSSHIYNETKRLTANGCIKTGYDFAGWNTESDGSGISYGDNVEVQGIYTEHNGTYQLYAMWNPRHDIAYKVTHYLQNGSDSGYTLKETNQYNNGTADASRTFAPNTYEGFTSPSNQTVTIKADGSTVVRFNYTRNTYTIAYSCNGGGGSTASSSHKYDVEKALTTNNCTMTGHKFDGWAKSASGSVVYTDGQLVKSLTSENGKTITLYAHWSNCSSGTYGSNGKTCTSCPTGYTSAAGSDSIDDCYLVTDAGKYVATANKDQVQCVAGSYCPGGVTIEYGDTGGRNNCPSNYGSSAAGSNEESDCYLTTVAGNYVATAKQNQSTCTAGGYCKGDETVYYGNTGGRKDCPTSYTSSPAGSTAASNCFLTTSSGKYVATKNAAQVDCAAGGYCEGNVVVNYGNTGGRETCPTNYTSSAAGSNEETDCYLTTDAGEYVKTAKAAPATCAAGGYCPGGVTVKYGSTGGRNGCPTYYGSSAAGSKVNTDCYLTTSAGKYVKTKKANEVSCESGYYCPGGTNVYYNSTGGRSECSEGYHSDAGASSCTANTYTVVYNKNSSSASGTMSNSTHTYDVAKKLTDNDFSRSGYTFNGWNTKADGSGTSYSNKASVSNLTSTNNGTVTLYAKWKLAVSCDNAAITYYNQNEQRSPIPCNIYNGVYNCSANTSTGKCDCTIVAFRTSSGGAYCCNFDKTSISASYDSSTQKYYCYRSYTPVSKGSTCQVVNNSYDWCNKYW